MKILDKMFPKWSSWKDVEIFQYYDRKQFWLLQVSINENGKKRFRSTPINDLTLTTSLDKDVLTEKIINK